MDELRKSIENLFWHLEQLAGRGEFTEAQRAETTIPEHLRPVYDAFRTLEGSYSRVARTTVTVGSNPCDGYKAKAVLRSFGTPGETMAEIIDRLCDERIKGELPDSAFELEPPIEPKRWTFNPG